MVGMGRFELETGCGVSETGARRRNPEHSFAKDLSQKLVGTGRFELPTPRTPSECSTRLSHVPTWKDSASVPAPRSAQKPQRRGSE